MKEKKKVENHEHEVFPNIANMEDVNLVRIVGKVNEILKYDRFTIMSISHQYATRGKVYNNNLGIFVFDYELLDFINERIKDNDILTIVGHIQTRPSNNGILEISIIADKIML